MEQKHSHTPDPIEAFNLVHKRKDNHKSWIDDASEQMGYILRDKIYLCRLRYHRSLTQLVSTHGEETPELKLQAYVTVRGFETGGRVRGYEDVVTPDMVPWMQQTQPTSSIRRSRRGRDYISLESSFLDMLSKYEE
ncbi:uncharacterized protein Fot_17315 [Forsythia ovata]|uniref:Uncharacterized protein n=1 Tax=Forsythia ovata TaxID=205694 RepID=A0ABD1VF06_9LAMI